MKRGLMVAALHIAMVLSIAGKYAWDRQHLPRAWARTINFDPNLPIRGRYVNLRLVVPLIRECSTCSRVLLRVVNGELRGEPGATGERYFIRGYDAVLVDPLAYFLPEHALDPTSLKPGEQLWVEVSVPPKGTPRPLQLQGRKPVTQAQPLRGEGGGQ